ncbi:Cytochrome c554 and c-prime [Maridesulfovibrio ferrireducens]|uniref:Cytochrome c554 and c-prime n=1 Tax=Maridesulfovibrio ferrireducens TaxID=246191 RepID=A0A1G9H0K8_9BACT|nr:multiheme c-type cytochrome [Maridesulfovibrio ferrireducens]SDL06409.1 Cytochrome c554 and c-prime [Maridesulfovibrio ferrireducens]
MKRLYKLLIVVVTLMTFGGCTTNEPVVDVAKITSEPKTFVGSETCKTCHLEHYDSWKATNHSRMAQNAKSNVDAFIVDINDKVIKADFQKLADAGKLKAPVDQIYFPTKNDILYTLGNEWKQRYIVKKDGILYISPIQFNTETGRWVNYHEADWDKRPWLLKCGGCHTTGTKLDMDDMSKSTFTEPGVGCESCHGAGSWHVALPKTAVFEKRDTIVNPAKLPRGVAVQICGSCHNRGSSTMAKGAGWPVGYTPGKALETYYTSTSFAAGDKKHMYPNEFSKGHHQQYIDWLKSEHRREGVTCTSCHFVHQLGMPSTRFQTKGQGSSSCLTCHKPANQNMAHSIHSFANCIGCHMPRIAKSAESRDIHSHVFKTLLPSGTLENPAIPNSCQNCHRHKDENLAELQKRFKILSSVPKPQGKVVEPMNAYK